MTNEQLKDKIVASIRGNDLRFLDVVNLAEDLCRLWKVGHEQMVQVVPMVLRVKCSPDKLTI
jgi:hypothetical protein